MGSTLAIALAIQSDDGLLCEPAATQSWHPQVGGAAKFQKLVAPLLQEVLQGYNAVKDRVAQEYPERAKDANYINDNFFSCASMLPCARVVLRDIIPTAHTDFQQY